MPIVGIQFRWSMDDNDARFFSAMKYTLLFLGALLSISATAEGLPPIPASLLNQSAVACIKIADDGSVSDAFLVTSTGDDERDQAAIAWVKQLHWKMAKPGDVSRNKWTPMPFAFGEVSAPPMPAHCEPVTH